MNKLIGLLLLSLLIPISGRTQSFRFQASVDAVQKSGFHRVLLSPDVVGHLNASLTDVRLYDSQHQEVPYLWARQHATQSDSFIDYELTSKQLRPNVSTTLVIRNQTKQRINSLNIVVKNTNVGKKARLSGSSDAQNWYAIDDEIWLRPTQNTVSTTEVKQIDFPLSDYSYYRLIINDSLSTPLNILRIGHYEQLASMRAYSIIPNISFSQRDSSDKNTYIHLVRPNDARFDKLTILVNASLPFRRRADIGQFRTRRLKRGRIDHWFEIVRTIELNSTDSNVVDLPGLKAKDLYVVVANDDNPPLVIREVRAYQLTTYLLANLTAGQSYQLHFSADNTAAPTYDLTPFKTVALTSQPIIGIGNLRSIGVDSDRSTSFFTDNRVIWPALSLVLLVLGIMSYRMLREMGQKQTDEVS
ncbi:hypothetical protein GO755_02115 [Spirosoma sp. HMF4905]|uniref:DUF3999 domain-containing protein n=1 Tax=Spirosoma arboris TaxID=2682092 RepID=A0A7K1S4Q8_9BACT|nr:hypothetical protein [Spirosoma arboris]MVM28812.1 hypothetical protein [Spirosoma arboris]